MVVFFLGGGCINFVYLFGNMFVVFNFDINLEFLKNDLLNFRIVVVIMFWVECINRIRFMWMMVIMILVEYINSLGFRFVMVVMF